MHILEYVCDEMEELERKTDKNGKLSMQEMQYLDMLAHTKKNLLKADEMEEESEYSGAYGRRSNREGSYARRRDAMGRYSRERSYGGYSMAEDDFKDELRDLMQSAPNEQVRMKLQRMMSEM